MTKGLKTLLFIGVAACVVTVIKRFFSSHDQERPTIRVRSGGSLELEAEGGEFVELGTEWRHDHHAKGPNRLEVTMVGTDCGSARFSTNRVEIHCKSSGTSLQPVTIQRRGSGGASSAYVHHRRLPRSQPAENRVLVWPDDHSVVIDEVRMNGTRCRVTNPATAEVIIKQKR